jgi:hypothetical protein
MNKYILKRGVFLRQIGLMPLCESTLRNNDELAEQYLKNDPTLIRYFDSVPAAPVVEAPKKKEEPIIIEPEIAEPAEPEVKIIKAVRKTGKRAKTKK